jgi:hypothetical protein
MKLSIFDGSEDAYWWIICSEKSFNSRNQIVSDAEKIMECAFAMKGSALTWWLRWYPRNSSVNWDAFTSIFLWHFKPEWRVILPLPDEEEESVQELEQSVSIDAYFSTIVDDVGKSQHETSPKQLLNVNSPTEEN